MQRYLLDTNVLIFYVFGNKDEISRDTTSILKDNSNVLYTSSIVLAEINQLMRLKKIQSKVFKTHLQFQEVLDKEFLVEILPFTKHHTKTLAELTIKQGHNDPFDHAIISHAITDKLTLISSDRQFENYTTQKLKICL
jgi:PIN domain nuclease of toxin-antitoxin system